MEKFKKYSEKIYALIAVLFWVAIWHIAAVKVGKSVLLPTPAQTMRVLGTLAFDGQFWYICFLSVRNIFLGALTGVIVGAVIAVLSFVSPILRVAFSPLLTLTKATPVASFIILFLVWMGKAKIPFVIAMMMVTPIVCANLLEGLRNIDRSLLEVARVYGLGFKKKWNMLYRYSLMPYFISSLKSGLALAWKAGIATEVLCTPDGTIGKMLNESKLYMETPALFAWTLTVVLLSLILEKSATYLSRRLLGGVK